MVSSSEVKKNSGCKSIMMLKGKSKYYSYAVLGICIAASLPLIVTANRRNENLPIRRRVLQNEPDLVAAESQTTGISQHAPIIRAQSAPVPTAAMPPPKMAPPPSPPLAVAASSSSMASYANPFPFPRSDLTSAPSYSPRYSVPSRSPWDDEFPFEMQSFRRRAQHDDDAAAYPEDDYKPSESKGKKHSPSIFKRVTSSIRNTGKAIVGAPSYIFKRYRGSWKRVWSGGKKKKKGGWKGWSSGNDGGGGSDKNDGWGGWEESDNGYDYESSHYPSNKGWGKGYSNKGGSYDSHERRYDRDYKDNNNYRDYKDNNYRDYKDREYRDRDYRDRDYRDDYKDYDNYRSPPSSSPRSRDRQSKWNSNNNSYREETHYDDYDGRRTTAYYGPSRKSPPSSSSSSSSPPPSSSSSKRPYNSGGSSSSGSGKSSSNRYNDEY